MAGALFPQLASLPDLRLEALSRLRHASRPIVMYGAGSYASAVQKYLTANGITIDALFVDPHYERREGVYHLEQIFELYPRFSVVIGTADHRRSRQMLQSLPSDRIAGIEHFVLSPHYLAAVDSAFIIQHAHELNDLYSIMSDDLSRYTLAAYITAVATGDDAPLFDVFDPSQYFQDCTPIDRGDVLVDGGAFTGDTLLELIRRRGACFAKYYAFEPDKHNFAQLDTTARRLGSGSVTCYNAGLWRETGSMRFAESSGGSTESKLGENGTVEIALQTIDQSCADATFIKMDIEGAELDALVGATETLRSNKPKLAICVYHQPDHLWTLMEYARRQVPEYKFYLRQHRTICTELVLYATC